MKRTPPDRLLLAIGSLSAGGAERVMSEMANWWNARGKKIAVWTLFNEYPDHYSLDPGIQRVAFHWKPAKTRFHIPWQSAMNKLIMRDVIRTLRSLAVISFIDMNNIRILTNLWGTGIPVVISERIDPRHHRIEPLWELLRRITYPFCSALVVQTRAVAEGWARRVVPEDKITVIPNFVRPIPEHNGTSPLHSEQTIVSVGRLVRQKGHDILIRAFASLGEARKGWRLVILGEGPERNNLQNLASSLGIQDSLSLPGIVTEPAHWLYPSSIFVLPSRYEGFPNALLEAMACGCAAVAADCPSGPREIIQHGVNGLLVPPDDPHALAHAISLLISHPTLRLSLGHNATSVSSTFSQQNIMTMWDNLIERVRTTSHGRI